MDAIFPTLVLADSLFRKGAQVEQSASDNQGIRSREFTTDVNWRQWQSTDAAFKVPSDLAAQARLWYRVTDSCGNAVIEEVPLTEGTVAVGPGADGQENGRGKPARYRMAVRDGVVALGREARSVACYDAMGVFAGWARPAGAGRWVLPNAKGPRVVEVR
jgi:hypothetical protein